MPKTFNFVGADVNLGRFGPVKKGDLLVLTDQEAEHVIDDDRFEQMTDEAIAKRRKEAAAKAAKEAKEQADAAAKAEKEAAA